MSRRNRDRWIGPMYAIPWNVNSDIVKDGAWALFATDGTARNWAIDHNTATEPVQVIATIQLPNHNSHEAKQ